MKRISLVIFGILILQYTQAQLHMGLHTDNYAGIYNINFQPADIVDSRYRFDMNIIQTEFTLSNNYVALKKEAIFNSKTAFSDPNFKDKFLYENLKSKNKKVFMGSNSMLPLSFYFQFGKKMKNALAFSSRLRFNLNIAGFEEDFATQIYNGLELSDLYFKGIENENLSIQAAAWSEIGITYGREIIDLGHHYVKGAFTGKLNQGFASAYVFSDNLDATFTSDSSVSVDNSDVAYDLSTNIFDFSSPSNPVPNFIFKPTFSADIGFVYEWRPNIDEYKYTLDGDPNILDRKKNKYKLKASIAFTDIGFLRFQRTPHSKIFHADFDDVSTHQLERLIANFGNDGLSAIDSAYNVSGFGTSSDPDGAIYSKRLPFKINIMVDYHIWDGFYVNATASIAPSFKKDANKTIGISQYSITPRYEHRWFGVYTPFSIDGVGRAHIGFGLRAGPVTFGVNDIIPLMAGKNYNVYGANFYVGAKIPIFARLKDRDKDHVSNKKDLCRKIPGTWEAKGCPDSDLDGVTDDKDACPQIPGVKELDGCPDTDGDGITDTQDDCPEIAGLEKFKGCPDTDGDNLMDKEDDCPNIFGRLAFNGCPDTDGDGVKDSEDNCPEIAGLIENKGCPYSDTDGDGIKDKNDNCPDIAGPESNNGCPYSDTDKDGVIDIEDDCINTPGPVENKGCPIIKEEVKEAIQTAFDNLQFVSGKSVILPSSYPSLQNLSKILKDNPKFKLKIAGHTDSIGSEDLNLTLSRNRANAVKTYLRQHGIIEMRFIIEAYGETQPISSNETAEGRQDNRRVEMEIVMD